MCQSRISTRCRALGESVSQLPSLETEDESDSGHVADAAARQQDRAHFEGWNRPECIPDLSVRRG